MAQRAGLREGPGWLRRDAERVAGALPPLMAEARRLAATVASGVHGRRRAGPGETFWQYRQAMPGDPLTAIDWRRSARSDHVYIREMEWEAAQTVWIWRDDAQSMDWRSDAAPRSKGARAALLALSLAVLLARGGERFGLIGTDAARPMSGEAQLSLLTGKGGGFGHPVRPSATSGHPDGSSSGRFPGRDGLGRIGFQFRADGRHAETTSSVERLAAASGTRSAVTSPMISRAGPLMPCTSIRRGSSSSMP